MILRPTNQEPREESAHINLTVACNHSGSHMSHMKLTVQIAVSLRRIQSSLEIELHEQSRIVRVHYSLYKSFKIWSTLRTPDPRQLQVFSAQNKAQRPFKIYSSFAKECKTFLKTLTNSVNHFKPNLKLTESRDELATKTNNQLTRRITLRFFKILVLYVFFLSTNYSRPGPR